MVFLVWERLTVWCGIASFGVLGPYFFEDNEGAAVTVTSEHYVAMLCNFCDPELRRRGIDLSSVWFQQDVATAHTARASMSVLREMFHGRHVLLISPPVITFYGVSQKQSFHL